MVMSNDSGRSVSVWMKTARIAPRKSLGEDADTDVCVVGAGIAGLSVAYMLARKGVRVVVLDDGPIGGGATCRTTAHLASAQDDRFYLLEEKIGEKNARLMAESHGAAIEAIEAISGREGIECEFERVDGYLVMSEGHALEGADLIEREFKAAKRAGLGVAREERAPIPSYNTGMCLKFKGQGQFHPLKYLGGLAHAVESAGGKIYERSGAAKIKGGGDARVETREGHVVRADSIVVATNSPVNDRVKIHTKQAPYRSYVVGFQVERGAIPHALFWDGVWTDEDESYHYVRVAPGPAAEGGGSGGEGGEPLYDVLIVGGEDHKTGQADDYRERYRRLEEWTRVRFREAKGVLYRWSGQVLEPADGAAFIGRNPMGPENVYIATGDSGQGMTHGTIAGMLITDLIRGEKNPWAEVYSPGRSVAGGEFWSENLNVAKQYGDWFRGGGGRGGDGWGGEVDSVEKLARGQGAVLRRGLKKVAVYRAEDGSVTELSAMCTHLGCVVRWNSGEGSWDCPCHGSRFDTSGKVLNGPAIKGLKVEKQEAVPEGRQGEAGAKGEEEGKAEGIVERHRVELGERETHVELPRINEGVERRKEVDQRAEEARRERGE